MEGRAGVLFYFGDAVVGECGACVVGYEYDEEDGIDGAEEEVLGLGVVRRFKGFGG